MGPYNSPLFASVPLLDAIYPAAAAAGTYTSSGFSTSGIAQFEAVVVGGTLGASGTLDGKFQYSVDGGTTWTDVDSTRCKIAQIAANNTVARLAVRTEALASISVNAATAMKVRFSLTVGTATSPVAALVFGADSRFEPGSNIAAVASTYLYTRSNGQP